MLIFHNLLIFPFRKRTGSVQINSSVLCISLSFSQPLHLGCLFACLHKMDEWVCDLLCQTIVFSFNWRKQCHLDVNAILHQCQLMYSFTCGIFLRLYMKMPKSYTSKFINSLTPVKNRRRHQRYLENLVYFVLCCQCYAYDA